MGHDVAEAVSRFVERRARHIDRLDITWFGGEPLANLSAIVHLSNRFLRICSDNDIELTGFMSTNGYLLTDRLLGTLVGLGISRYQVTFDGPAVVHDRVRVLRGGGNTFSRIWKNLRSFHATDHAFQILIRVQVTPDSLSQVASFLADLRDEFSSDSRFKIMVINVCHWGGPNDSSIPLFVNPAPVLRSLGVIVGEMNVPADGESCCEAANPTHLVVRPTGVIVKCAHSLDLAENRIGHLAADGRVVYEPGTIDFWIRGILNGDYGALRCPRQGFVPSTSPTPLVQVGIPARRRRDADGPVLV